MCVPRKNGDGERKIRYVCATWHTSGTECVVKVRRRYAGTHSSKMLKGNVLRGGYGQSTMENQTNRMVLQHMN